MTRVWERIPATGALSYWSMTLARNVVGESGRPGVVYLAVSRDKAKGGWRWALRGPEFGPEPGYRIHEQGHSGTVAGAKRAAARAVLDPHCISCGTELDTGTADIFQCPGCGDEWGPEAWPYYLPDSPTEGSTPH